MNETIKPNQPETIYDHEWHEFNEGRVTIDKAGNQFISITIESANTKKWPILYRALIGEKDALAIANHFNLIPKQLKLGNANEYINGEIVEVAANYDFQIGGFMTEDRNDD